MTEPADKHGRPILDPHLGTFVAALAADRPQAFGHLDARRILFVAGAARREARASIRPLRFEGGRQTQGALCKPAIEVRGQDILYEICLRPRFFLDATVHERARIIAHELWHISVDFDGTLQADRRHGARSEADLRRALDADLGAFDPRTTDLWPCLARDGELRMQAWRARPPSEIPLGETHRTAYTDEDLFLAIVAQR